MNPVALVEQLRAWGQDPNVRHFLDVVIPGAEGTTEHGYNTAFGGGRFESLADHPRYLKPFKQTDGKTNYTSAAGKYQFLSNTWDETAKALGLTDFGPESQDLGALYLLHQKGVLPYLKAGDFKTAVDRTGSVWASLPSSNYPQPKRDAGFIEGLVNRMIPAAQAGVLPPELRTQKPVVDPAVLNEYNKVYGEDAGFIPAVIGIDNWKRALQARFDATGEDMGGNFDEFTKYMTPDEVSRLNAYLGKGSSTQSQRNTAMNPNSTPTSGSSLPYNPQDPASIYQFMMSQQQNLPVQQLTDEQKAALLEGRQQRAAMLPMAMAASLAGDKRVSGMGQQLQKDAMAAQGAMQLGNEGWLTSDGQFIQNPFTEANRQEQRGDRMLQLAVQSARSAQDRELMNLLRAQQVTAAQTDNAPANLVPGPDGKPMVDANAPWGNLSNKQAGPLRASTLTSAQKQLQDMREATQGDAASIQMMDQFLNLNSRESTGGLIDKFGPDSLKYGDTAAMLALQKKMTPLQRPPGSGATSDFEQRMYALGIPNISNDFSVNQQTKLANEALVEVRAARLKHYEEYLARFGHLNGAESSFAPQISGIEKRYQTKIDAISKARKSALPRATGQVSNKPQQGDSSIDALLEQYK